MEECLKKSRDEIKEKMTRDKLSLEKYKEFQNGEDKIKDKTYETLYEYTRAFLDEVVFELLNKKCEENVGRDKWWRMNIRGDSF